MYIYIYVLSSPAAQATNLAIRWNNFPYNYFPVPSCLQLLLQQHHLPQTTLRHSAARSSLGGTGLVAVAVVAVGQKGRLGGRWGESWEKWWINGIEIHHFCQLSPFLSHWSTISPNGFSGNQSKFVDGIFMGVRGVVPSKHGWEILELNGCWAAKILVG